MKELLRMLGNKHSAHERQRQEGFAWLRFEPGLEAAFREFNYLSFRRTRYVALLLLTLTLLGFLGFDIYQAMTVPAPVLTGTIITARLLAIGLAGLAAWRLRREKNFRAVDIWISTALGSAGLMTWMAMLIYAQEIFHLPLLIDGGVLILMGTLFPVGQSFWRSARLALAIAVLFWVGTPLFLSQDMRHDFFSILPFQLTSFVILVAMRYYQEHAMRCQFLLNGALSEIANTDGLTGLNNRRAFEFMVQQALLQASREHKTTALMLVDVDHFKKYNDHYGHPVGDDTLKSVAQALGHQPSRPLDLVARMGGEEFALFFYDVDEEFALRTANRVCEEIECKLAIPHEKSTTASVVTLSIGVVMSRSGDALAALYQRADEALYLAKEQGRNRACLAA